MAKWYLTTAFSLNMLGEGCFWQEPNGLLARMNRDQAAGTGHIDLICEHSYASLDVEPVPLETAQETLRERQFIFAVGHEGTAKVLSQLLGVLLAAKRSGTFTRCCGGSTSDAGSELLPPVYLKGREYRGLDTLADIERASEGNLVII